MKSYRTEEKTFKAGHILWRCTLGCEFWGGIVHDVVMSLVLHTDSAWTRRKVKFMPSNKSWSSEKRSVFIHWIRKKKSFMKSTMRASFYVRLVIWKTCDVHTVFKDTFDLVRCPETGLWIVNFILLTAATLWMLADFIGHQLHMWLYQPFLRPDTSFKLKPDRPHLLLGSPTGHLLVTSALPPLKWHLCSYRNWEGLWVVWTVEE